MCSISVYIGVRKSGRSCFTVGSIRFYGGKRVLGNCSPNLTFEQSRPFRTCSNVDICGGNSTNFTPDH